MIVTSPSLQTPIRPNPKLPTWFGIGGGADAFAVPESPAALAQLLADHSDVRVLGDGANLLVDDDGVGGLVVALTAPAFGQLRIDARSGYVVAGAGVKLPKLIKSTVTQGLAGLETLGGIPATVGGALVMNAGGKFGQISDCVVRVHGMDRLGRATSLDRREIAFDYRHSGLGGLILTHAELQLTPSDAEALAGRHLEIMEYKKASQPLSASSAGCVFKNPVLPHDVAGPGAPIGKKGQRVSAGLLIDRAGLKGLRVGGASVSDVHGNFIVTEKNAAARHVIELMDEVSRRVMDAFGVRLDPEVVVWKRTRA